MKADPKNWRINLDSTSEIGKVGKAKVNKAYIIFTQLAFKCLYSLDFEENNMLYFL